MRDCEKMLQDWRLTTAEIYYYLPDHPLLLQSFVWQELDYPPEFPSLKRFLHFWEGSIEGRLHSVQVASCQWVTPASWQNGKGEFRIH